eukprot:336970-Rhodomonas_salina.1
MAPFKFRYRSSLNGGPKGVPGSCRLIGLTLPRLVAAGDAGSLTIESTTPPGLVASGSLSVWKAILAAHFFASFGALYGVGER